MADSKQLDIMRKLTTHLEGVTIANGYEFDMAGRVFRGRMVYGAADPVPMLSLTESTQTDIAMSSAAENKQLREETWIIFCQGWTEHEARNPTDRLYNLKASVEHRLARLYQTNQYGDALYPAEYFLGYFQNGIADISVGQGVVYVPRDAASAYAFFYVPIAINWAFDAGDPFVVPFVTP